MYLLYKTFVCHGQACTRTVSTSSKKVRFKRIQPETQLSGSTLPKRYAFTTISNFYLFVTAPKSISCTLRSVTRIIRIIRCSVSITYSRSSTDLEIGCRQTDRTKMKGEKKKRNEKKRKVTLHENTLSFMRHVRWRTLYKAIEYIVTKGGFYFGKLWDSWNNDVYVCCVCVCVCVYVSV